MFASKGETKIKIDQARHARATSQKARDDNPESRKGMKEELKESINVVT